MTQPTWEGPIPTSGRQRRGVLAPVLGLIALGICGLVVLGVVVSSIGIVAVLVGAFVALVPVALVVATFLWVDRWEPEPPRLLLFAFLWGACFAALSALVINTSAALVADQVLGRGSGDIIGTVAVAPIVEEAVKGVFLVGLLVFRRREFDGVMDGIVYAGMVAAGFAFTENILYFGRAFAEAEPQSATTAVLAVFVLRGLLSPFAHPLFTAMTGIGAGIASNSRNPFVRIAAVLLGYAMAVTLHALWNGSAALQGGEAVMGVYGFVMLPLFLAMIGLVVWQRRREQRIVIEQLPGFAQAGWIANSEIPLLSSLAGRNGWRAAVRRRSGKKVAKAVSDYQAAVTDLAFLRSRMSRGSVGSQTGMFWHGEALAQLNRARNDAIGHPEALTVALRHGGPVGSGAAWTPPPPGSRPPGSPGSPPGSISPGPPLPGSAPGSAPPGSAPGSVGSGLPGSAPPGAPPPGPPPGPRHAAPGAGPRAAYGPPGSGPGGPPRPGSGPPPGWSPGGPARPDAPWPGGPGAVGPGAPAPGSGPSAARGPLSGRPPGSPGTPSATPRTPGEPASGGWGGGARSEPGHRPAPPPHRTDDDRRGQPAEESTRRITRPAGAQPGFAADRPVSDRPVPDRPVPDRPVPDRPVPDRPVPDRPVPDRPVPDRSGADRPSADPTDDEPTTRR